MSPPRESREELLSETSPTLEEVHNLFREAIVGEPAISLLKGFKLDFSGTRGFHKVFFSVRCDCGTAALLSVEVARSKTLSQVKENLPELIQHLKVKAQQFANMTCEMHTRMRKGGPTQASMA